MKIVKLIRDLVIEEVPLAEGDSVKYWVHENPKNMHYVGDGYIKTTETVKEHIAPVLELWNNRGENQERTYIAVTEEVKELLQVPFESLMLQLSETEKSRDSWCDLSQEATRKLQKKNHECHKLKDKIHNINRSSFWCRLKLLFTGINIEL